MQFGNCSAQDLSQSSNISNFFGDSCTDGKTHEYVVGRSPTENCTTVLERLIMGTSISFLKMNWRACEAKQSARTCFFLALQIRDLHFWQLVAAPKSSLQ